MEAESEQPGEPIPNPLAASAAPRLSVVRKANFGSGDLTVNTVLVSLSNVYTAYIQIEIAELNPFLAGLVPLVGRVVDAVTDPLMGRLSDHTRSRWGRRRPYFLLGAIPFGLSFALLWTPSPFPSQEGKFVYYAFVYILVSLSITVVSVPYLSLMPEMAIDYDERTSLNAFRNGGSLLGIFVAIMLRPVAGLFGEGLASFTAAGMLFGVLVAVPWLFVFRASFERPEFQRETRIPTLEGLRILWRNQTYLRLMALYLAGRVAMDLVGPLLILYFTHVLGRSGDFEIAMGVFVLGNIVSLPFWLWISRRQDKATSFVIGALWWMSGNMIFFFIEPDWPRWVGLLFAFLIGLGFAAADLMPWAMIGDVVDEDDLRTNERREGLYNGFFTFLRKIAGAIGVFLALTILGFAGLKEGKDVVQPESAISAIRWLTALGPSAFIALGAWLTRGYPLTRARHEEILSELAARDAVPADAIGRSRSSDADGG